MKRQEKTLGETDPDGCAEAERRRNHCAHPPVAELHRLYCADCKSESTDDGRVVFTDKTISFSLDELDGAKLDFRRLGELDAELKNNPGEFSNVDFTDVLLKDKKSN
jgi:hypothetical protein